MRNSYVLSTPYGSVLALLFSLTMMFLVIIFWGRITTIGGGSTAASGVINNALCPDCQPCRQNFYHSATESCSSQNLPDGSSCPDDVCYKNDVEKTCSCGRCTSTRGNCRGSCTTVADCPVLNTTLSSPILSTECFENSCFYTLERLASQSCASWLSDTDLVNQNCLIIQQDLVSLFTDALPEPPGAFCSYQFACAPICYGTTEECLSK